MINIHTFDSAVAISDGHYRNPNKTDESHYALMSILNPAKYDLLALLGDNIDMTRSSRPSKHEVEFMARCRQFKQCVVILGNHEYPYYRAAGIYFDYGLEKICKKYRFYSGGELIILEHGHRFDPNCNGENALYWNRALVRATTFLDKLFKCDVQEYLREKRWIDKALRDIENDKGIMQRAIKKYEAHDAWVIIGHRHAPYINYKKKFADCGDWIHNRSYVTIENGKVELHEAKNEK